MTDCAWIRVCDTATCCEECHRYGDDCCEERKMRAHLTESGTDEGETIYVMRDKEWERKLP